MRKPRSEFRRAVELAPADTRCWAALFYFLVRGGQQAEATQTLEQIAGDAQVPPADRSFLLAQGYQTIGDVARAAAWYDEAEKLAPDSVAVKLQKASFYLPRDRSQAEKLLRAARQIAPQNAEVRRRLVDFLASAGSDEAWTEAQQLLEDGDVRSLSPADIRIRAALLVRRNRPEDRRAAKRLLEQLLEEPANARPVDRLLLAQLYALEGRDQAAREQFLYVVERPAVEAAELAVYLDFLLNRGRTEEAGPWLAKLQSAAPDDPGTVRLRARWLHATSQDQTLVEVVESHAEQRDRELAGQQPQRQQLASEIANLYVLVEQPDAAERWFRRLVELDPRQYGALARFLAETGRTEEATRICLAACRQEATAESLAELTEILLQAEPDPAQEGAVEPLLTRGISEHPRNARLLFSVGNLRLRQDRNDEAIELLQRSTEIDPRNYLAWNNLAAVLGERPERQPQALQSIDRAMAEAGRRLSLLLDTKAAILLHQGKAREAAALLEEAISAQANDPRFFFHLSLAYDQLGLPDKARQALKSAQDRGLKTSYLSRLEWTQLQSLEQRLSTRPLQKERASRGRESPEAKPNMLRARKIVGQYRVFKHLAAGGSLALLLAGLGLTLADGVVHGRLTYRWSGSPAERKLAATRLQEIPANCGDWTLASSRPLEDEAVRILACEGYLNRVYVNRRTGQAVSVTLMVGPFGPTSAHTPAVCFSSRDYTISQEPSRALIAEGSSQDSEVWVVTVRSNQLDGETRRVYYGWSDGGPWKAPREPRLYYGGRPYLYKIQASIVLSSAESPAENDACREFLAVFLPQVRSYLLPFRS